MAPVSDAQIQHSVHALSDRAPSILVRHPHLLRSHKEPHPTPKKGPLLAGSYLSCTAGLLRLGCGWALAQTRVLAASAKNHRMFINPDQSQTKRFYSHRLRASTNLFIFTRYSGSVLRMMSSHSTPSGCFVHCPGFVGLS